MCGIAGLYRPQMSESDADALLAGMLQELGHRGPESVTLGRVEESCLGHAMLAFVVPRSTQPVLSGDGRVGLAFDGQVYNYRELARALGLPRDTAEGRVVLEAYLRWGADMLPRLRGMFGLAVIDGRDRSLLLARDPLGRKPLYYLRDGEGVAFASELKALRPHPSFNDAIDAEAVAHYAAFNAVPAPLSIFSCARKLRAGSWLRFAAGEVQESTYWTLPDRPGDLDLDEVEATAELRRRLEAAVDRRLDGTDAPLGVALSGGVDSAVIAALVARREGAPRSAFTVGFGDSSYDESSRAAAIAAHLGLEHHVVEAGGGEILRVVEEKYPNLDEPLADPSMLPTLLLCELAGGHVKGLLSGDGADEVHLGYLSFQASQALAGVERLVPAPVLGALESAVRFLPPGSRNADPRLVLRMMSKALHSRPELRFYDATALLPFEELSTRPWSEDVAPYMASLSLTSELDAFVDPELPSLDRVQRAIVCHFLRDVILTKVDRASMMHSIEARCPFLDVDVVEWSFRLPASTKFRFGQGKVLLRRLAADLLPAGVRRRRKQGFRPPLARLLREDLRQWMLGFLSARNVTRVGVFNTRLVVRLVDEHLRGVADHHRTLWSLICFHQWHKHHTHTRFGLRRPALDVTRIEPGSLRDAG